MTKEYIKRKTLLERFMDWVNSDWQWTGHKINGYGQIKVNRKGKQAHRVSYELFNGQIPDGKDVLHSCDDRGCVNPDCLHLGNALMNSQEKIMRGRARYDSPKGEKSGRAKLTNNQVIEMRNKYKEGGATQKELSEKYGVTESVINRIIHEKIWKSVL